jgi:hypothetical protein
VVTREKFSGARCKPIELSDSSDNGQTNPQHEIENPVIAFPVLYPDLMMRQLVKNSILFVVCILFLSACGTVRDSPKYQLSDGAYFYRQKDAKYRKAIVYVHEDSIKVFSASNPDELIIRNPGRDQFFLKPSFDLDVMTVGFKYRPATFNLPRQLTTVLMEMHTSGIVLIGLE